MTIFPANSASDDRMAQLQAEIAKLKQQLREAHRVQYLWEDPKAIQEQGRTGYNLKIEPELYLKIQWLMQNKGGIRSIQAFFEKAGNKLADEYLEELGAK